MTIFEYLRDRIPVLLLNLAAMIAVTAYLTGGGVSLSMTALLILGWAFLLFISFSLGYVGRSRYFRELEDTLNALDKPYLLGEIMGKPYRSEDRKYRQLIRRSNKAVIEAVRRLEDEQREYKEYIEGWIHDVKLPITAMELICQNQTEPGAKETARKIAPELSRMENLVESALFYARSDSVYQDYLIDETDLKSVVDQTIARNKAFLISHNMAIEVNGHCGSVFCDGKWLQFILGQILINAAKYKKDGGGRIRITGEDVKNGVLLSVEDEGVGIRASEIDRIFDKGFTGTNGRSGQTSTGIGLYLCRKLCAKLGIEITAESEEGVFTRIHLVFPKSDYHGC